MNDGFEYAKMLEIPVSNCDVVVKPAKKRRVKKENVEMQVIEAVNEDLRSAESPIALDSSSNRANAENENSQYLKSTTQSKKPRQKRATVKKDKKVDSAENIDFNNQSEKVADNFDSTNQSVSNYNLENAKLTDDYKGNDNFNYYQNKSVQAKKKFKLDIVYLEGIIVFVLAVSILLSNIFWENSGMNMMFAKVFNDITETEEDLRTYLSFNASSPVSDMAITLENGVMQINGEGSVYPICDGVVKDVASVNGKHTITISHSKYFETVIAGVDYNYIEEGDAVFKYVPISYLKDGTAEVSMYNNGSLLTNYIVEDNSIIWES